MMMFWGEGHEPGGLDVFASRPMLAEDCALTFFFHLLLPVSSSVLRVLRLQLQASTC